MQKNGVILLIILLCVAFLVSCGKRETAELEQGELVRVETEGTMPSVFFCCQASERKLRRNGNTDHD